MMLLYTLFTYDVIYNACLSTHVHVCSIHHDMNRAWMDYVCSLACSTFMHLSLCSIYESWWRSWSHTHSHARLHSWRACIHSQTSLHFIALAYAHTTSHCVHDLRNEWVSLLVWGSLWMRLMWWRYKTSQSRSLKLSVPHARQESLIMQPSIHIHLHAPMFCCVNMNERRVIRSADKSHIHMLSSCCFLSHNAFKRCMSRQHVYARCDDGVIMSMAWLCWTSKCWWLFVVNRTVVNSSAHRSPTIL